MSYGQSENETIHKHLSLSTKKSIKLFTKQKPALKKSNLEKENLINTTRKGIRNWNNQNDIHL